jgi:nucleoside-diphosphate-sugar epimerase
VTVETWVILGAGYTGGMLAERLVREGQRVIVTRRDPANARAAEVALGVTADAKGVAMNLAQPSTLAFPDHAIVVCLAPPGPHPAAEIEALTHAARGAQRLVYVSSTGVYPPARGEVVDESWPVAPDSATGRARAAAEAALPRDAIVLRAAGIYGPGRGLLERIRAGTYRIVGDGSAHVSRIHVIDLVDAIIRAGATTFAGPINVADDDPAPIGVVADSIAARLGLPKPPRVSPSSVDPEVAAMLTANRRISNKRLKDKLGVVLRYPSWQTLLSEWSGAPGAAGGG